MEQEILRPATAKWEATFTRRLAHAGADQIWPLLQDFFGIYKYFPGLTSYGIQGNNGEVGSIRYCGGFKIPSQEGKGSDEPPPVSWSKEKITAIDPIQRHLRYEMIDSNIGFNSYVSNIKVLMDPENESSVGCVIEWAISVDPVKGLTFEELAEKYEVRLEIMAQTMEVMEEESLKKPSKWEATVSARLATASADQIWPLLKDFFGIHKYFPNLPTCYGIHGNNGEIGSIRYCEGFEVSSQESNEGKVDGQPSVTKWTKEKIVAIDPTQRSLSYEIVDSNIGFNSYVSTIKAVMMNPESGDEDECVGCVLEWSFSVDPVEGFAFADFVRQYQVWIQIMAQKMENSLVKLIIGS